MAEVAGVDLKLAGSVPLQVQRALRAIATHPSVRAIDASFHEESACTRAIVSIDTDLPARWRIRGHSDNGVLALEPVSFVFGRDFPLVAPIIHLRDDFDRSHPHLQPWGPSVPPEPCLVLGSATELMRWRGIIGLVEQLVDWLAKAAMVELIDPRHGWEHTRRDHLQHHASADIDWLQGLPTRDGGAAAFETDFVAFRNEAGDPLYTVQLSSRRTSLSEENCRWRFGVRRDGGYYGNCVALVVCPGKLPSGKPFVADRYLPESVTDVTSLRERALELGCGEPLNALLTLLGRRMSGKKLKIGAPLLVILLARRPCNLIGASSPIELCSYLIELNGSDDLSRTSKTRVGLVAVEAKMSMDLLRQASADRVEDPRQPWTLLGCGSVGSKAAIHMARTGRGPAAVVDKSFMRPHNYGRHALTPMLGGDGTDYGAKADVLAVALAAMGQEPKVGRFDIVKAIGAVGLPKELADPGSFAIVNATASISVREALSLAHVVPVRPRVVEIGLFGAGRVGFMSIEGPNCNPTTNDLASEAYRVFTENSTIRDLVFNAEAEVLTIGQGCSSVTFPMPDAQLSALTAPMAGEIAKRHATGLSKEAGELLVGLGADDGLGQVWQRYRQPPWIVLSHGAGPAPSVHLSPRVDSIIRDDVAAKRGRETGGVLIGRFSEVTDTFHIVDLLPAPADSRFSTSEFVLGTHGLRKEVERIVTQSGGSLYPLGTWHNHLVTGGPSAKDIRTALQLANEQVLPVLMLIHTPGGYRYLVAEAEAPGPGWTDVRGA